MHKITKVPPWLLVNVIAGIVLVSGVVGVSYMGNNTTSLASNQIYIVTTTGMLADAARNIGGNKVVVDGLMGPGVDPHLYSATAGDLEKLLKADIIFINGLHLEAGMGEAIEAIKDKPVIAVGDEIPRELLLEGISAFQDPHIWFDVGMWKQVVQIMGEKLQKHFPSHHDYFQDQTEHYVGLLGLLQEYIQAQLIPLPLGNRTLVTAHDAFNYFGRAYNFTVVGLQGISTVTEAGTGDISALARFITDNQIPAIFIESSVPIQNVKAVQANCQDRGWVLKIGGELYSDAMGDGNSFDGTYIGMFKHNIDTIIGALLTEVVQE